MNNFEIGFIKLHPEAKLPQKTGVDSDACYDVWCTELSYLNETILQYKLGFTLNLPKNVKVNIYPRSSIYKHGLMLCNSVATIDEDYRGEYMLNFYHVIPSLEPYQIGDKIAQMEIGVRNNINFYETDVIDITQRGDLGFGSSGVK